MVFKSVSYYCVKSENAVEKSTIQPALSISRIFCYQNSTP
jgi:hypothetical protein